MYAVQVAPDEADRWMAATATSVAAVTDAFQGRWAKLLSSRFARDFRSYAEPSNSEGPQPSPPGLSSFQSVVELSASVEAACDAHAVPAAALRQTLHTLCHDLMSGRAASLQSQLLISLSGDICFQTQSASVFKRK